jgi:hypothetical protein
MLASDRYTPLDHIRFRESEQLSFRCTPKSPDSSRFFIKKNCTSQFFLEHSRRRTALRRTHSEGKVNDAVTETLFGSLKAERLHGERFATIRKAQDAVLDLLLWYEPETPSCAGVTSRNSPTSDR